MTNPQSYTDAVIKLGTVVDDSRYPRVIYQIDNAALQPYAAIQLKAGISYELVHHQWRPGQENAAQSIGSFGSLSDVIDALEGR